MDKAEYFNIHIFKSDTILLNKIRESDCFMEKITSKIRVKETGASGELAYRYHVDYDTIWFNLEDICYFFNITSERFINKFYEEVLDYNKIVFLDDNNTCGKECRTKFVNKIAIQELEMNQTMRHAAINVDIEDLEKEEGLTVEEDENNYKFKELVQNIKTELYTADRTKLNRYVEDLVNTRQINEIIENKDYDFGIEREVQEYRDWLLEKYDPEKSLYIMHKGIHDNDHEHMYYEKYFGPSIDEALDILFNAGKEQ